ncbi:hypothetical protein SARC_14175, partial [Sphaeroforma arctica JP610]
MSSSIPPGGDKDTKQSSLDSHTNTYTQSQKHAHTHVRPQESGAGKSSAPISLPTATQTSVRIRKSHQSGEASSPSGASSGSSLANSAYTFDLSGSADGFCNLSTTTASGKTLNKTQSSPKISSVVLGLGIEGKRRGSLGLVEIKLGKQVAINNMSNSTNNSPKDSPNISPHVSPKPSDFSHSDHSAGQGMQLTRVNSAHSDSDVNSRIDRHGNDVPVLHKQTSLESGSFAQSSPTGLHRSRGDSLGNRLANSHARKSAKLSRPDRAHSLHATPPPFRTPSLSRVDDRGLRRMTNPDNPPRPPTPRGSSRDRPTRMLSQKSHTTTPIYSPVSMREAVEHMTALQLIDSSETIQTEGTAQCGGGSVVGSGGGSKEGPNSALHGNSNHTRTLSRLRANTLLRSPSREQMRGMLSTGNSSSSLGDVSKHEEGPSMDGFVKGSPGKGGSISGVKSTENTVYRAG